jgi:hypothetical protein
MYQRHVKWLYEELPVLVRGNVLREADADRLRAYYGAPKAVSLARIGVILCGVLAALLIGAGIIMLLAHNWEDLGRPVRAVLAFLPLIAGQALAGCALIRRRGSVAWCEGAGAFLTLAIGACISLISQTYQIPGNFEDFLFTWLLLVLPVIYLLNSTATAALYMAGVCAWAGSAQYYSGNALLNWPLIAAVLPHGIIAFRRNPESPRTLFFMYVLTGYLLICPGIVLEKAVPGIWIPVYGTLMAVFLLAARALYPGWFWHPLRLAGAAGTVMLAFAFTYEEVWLETGYSHYRHGARILEYGIYHDGALTLILIAAAVWLSVRSIRNSGSRDMVWMAHAVLSIAGFGLMNFLGEDTAIACNLTAFNLYLLGLGTFYFWRGIRNGHLLTANGGMAVLALLFSGRFFDSNLNLAFRGAVFILIGAGFLTANMVAGRRGRKNPGGAS